MKIQTVIFDLDGTLIDTEPSAVRAVKECFQEWKIPVDFQDITYLTGRTWGSAFEFLLRKYQIPVPEKAAEEKIMNRYRRILENELISVPGSVQAVQSLSTQFRLGLVSGSGRAEILWALKKLKIDSYFEIILGAEDYPRSKPQPDGYLKAIQTLHASAQACLVFEDSTAGIASARSAGTWVAAVTSTNHFQQDVSQAHFQISDLTPVSVEWIENLNLA